MSRPAKEDGESCSGRYSADKHLKAATGGCKVACRHCPLARGFCEWRKRSIVCIPMLPEGNNQAGLISAIPYGACEGK